MSHRTLTIQFVLAISGLLGHSAMAGTVWATGPIGGGGFFFNAPSVPVAALPGVDIVVFDADILNSGFYDRIQIELAGSGSGNLQPLIKGFAINDDDVMPVSIALTTTKQLLEFRFDIPLTQGMNPSHLAVVVPENIIVPIQDGGRHVNLIRFLPVGESFAAFFGLGFARIADYDPRPRPNAAKLTTGSRVSISQPIDVPSSAFTVSFDYLFQSRVGILDVNINGMPIGELIPTGGEGDSFQRVSFGIDGPLLAALQSPDGTLGSIELSFDGSANSVVLLDNIEFPSVLNGGFDADTFFGWDVFTEGRASAVIAVVPEPASWAYILTGLAGLWLAVRRRRYTLPCLCAAHGG